MKEQELMQAAEQVFNFGRFEQMDRALISVVVQDFETKAVLMVGSTDSSGIIKTLKSGKVTLWSVKRKKEWIKGEESGCFMDLIEAKVDWIGAQFCIRSGCAAEHAMSWMKKVNLNILVFSEMY
jgi:phosphoribosyl-AMP cyclohydrolase